MLLSVGLVPLGTAIGTLVRTRWICKRRRIRQNNEQLLESTSKLVTSSLIRYGKVIIDHAKPRTTQRLSLQDGLDESEGAWNPRIGTPDADKRMSAVRDELENAVGVGVLERLANRLKYEKTNKINIYEIT